MSKSTKQTVKISRDSSFNSFLEETEHNSDVESEIRIQIERRFQRSNTNKVYVFPRTQKRQRFKSPGNLRRLKSTKKIQEDAKSSRKRYDAVNSHKRMMSLKTVNSKHVRVPSGVIKKTPCVSAATTINQTSRLFAKSYCSKSFVRTMGKITIKP